MITGTETVGTYRTIEPSPSENLERLIYGRPQQFFHDKGEEISFHIHPLGESETRSSVTTLSFSEELEEEKSEEYVPRTPLGKRLFEIRKRAIAAGMKLLSMEEILEEVRRRRRELGYEEEDVS